MIRTILSLLLLMPLGMVHASGGGVPTVPAVTTLYSASSCVGLERESSVKLISTEEWKALLAAQPDKSKLDSGSEARQIVLVNMGEQRTAGYGVRLADEAAQVIDGRLRLPVSWVSPKPGMMQAQVITHPCLVVSVDTEFQQVDVVDQDGRVRLSTVSR